MDDLQESHEKQLLAFKQKMKYLIFENKIKLDEENIKNLYKLQNLDEARTEEIQVIQKDLIESKINLRKNELGSKNQLRETDLKYSKEVAELIRKFDQELSSIEKKFREIDAKRKNDLEREKIIALKELEERKDSYICQLKAEHEDSFEKIKTYYKEIIKKHLNLIEILRGEKESLIKSSKEAQCKTAKLTNQVKTLTNEIEKMSERNRLLEKSQEFYEKDKKLINRQKKLLNEAKDSMKSLEVDHELLIKEYELVKNERDTIHQYFVDVVQKIHQKCNLQNLAMSKKIELLLDNLETKELDSSKESNTSNERNIQLLKDEINNLKENYNSLLREYREDLKMLGVEKELQRKDFPIVKPGFGEDIIFSFDE